MTWHKHPHITHSTTEQPQSWYQSSPGLQRSNQTLFNSSKSDQTSHYHIIRYLLSKIFGIMHSLNSDSLIRMSRRFRQYLSYLVFDCINFWLYLLLHTHTDFALCVELNESQAACRLLKCWNWKWNRTGIRLDPPIVFSLLQILQTANVLGESDVIPLVFFLLFLFLIL